MGHQTLADLALNGALSLSLLGLWGAAMSFAEKLDWARGEQAMKAALLALGAGMTIIIAARFEHGVIFDQRGTMIGLAVLHAGPAGGVLAAAAAAAARWSIGGIGATAGFFGILFDLGLAIAVHRLLTRLGQTSAGVTLVAMGAATGAGEAASAWLIPGLSDPLSLAVLLLSAQLGGTVLIGGMLALLEERRRLRKSLQDRLDHLRRILLQTIDAFTTATVHSDPYTAGHEKRVAHLCVAIGERMGLSSEQLDGLRIAAEIHDIGQLNVPPEILLRPGTLTRVERLFIEQHPAVGADILARVDFPWPVADIVRQHHENCDGTGYPARLVRDQILLEARILRVADTVEAMCSHRPFRGAHSITEALAVLAEGRGTVFDAEVVDCCHTLFAIDGYLLPTEHGRPDIPQIGPVTEAKAVHHVASG